MAKMRYFVIIASFIIVFSLQNTAKAEDVDVAREAKERAEKAAQQRKAEPSQSPARQKASEEELAKIKEKMEANPRNLDAYFAYGRMATQLGKFDEAEKAFQHMLDANPRLPRVKLEMGILYIKKGELKNAKELFEEVLKTNPPEQVKKNVESVLAQVNDGLKKDRIIVSTSFGLNYDKNATSAASSNSNTVSDTSLPLTEGSLADSDGQAFGTASIIHLHKFDIESKDWGMILTTIGTLYKSIQGTEHQLDITLGSVKTGPTFTLNNYNTQIGIAAGKSVISLNSDVYMVTPSGEFTLKYAPIKELSFDYGYSYEYRKFANSPTALTNVNRTGNAYQHKVGATYMFTEKDLFNGSVTWRNEEARSNEFGNDQTQLTFGYTRQLPYDLALNILGNFKMTHYNDLDTTISSKILRRDKERSITFTLSKKLSNSVTMSGGYQYKNVTSNIENYDYFNNRLSWAVGWTF